MLRHLKEIERLQSPAYAEPLAAKVDELVKREFESVELTCSGDVDWDALDLITEDEVKSRMSELPEELQSIVKETPEGLMRRKDEIIEIFVRRARNIRRLEEEENETNAKCFKLLQERVSLFTAATKSSLENERLDEINENLREVCRMAQQRIKLSLQSHEEKATTADKNVNELVDRIKATISDVQSKIAKQEKLKEQQEKENNEFEAKIKEFKEHAKVRAAHFENQLKTKKLEVQLAEAKLLQEEKILEQVRAKIEAYKNHLNELKQNEKTMKAQIKAYEEKFEQFQESLSKSDEVFVDFDKRLKSIEESNNALKEEHKKYAEEKARMDVKLIKIFDEKQRTTEELEAKQKIKDDLEKKCRALQAARAAKITSSASS